MKYHVIIILLLTVLLLGIANICLKAQNTSACNPPPTNCESGWCWGNEPQKAKDTYTKFLDAIKLQSYKDAEEPATWLLANVPCVNEALYINAIKVYSGLAEGIDNEYDEYRNKNLGKALTMYEKRFELYGDKETTLQQIGLRYYDLLMKINNPKYHTAITLNNAFNVYEKIIEKLQTNIKYPLTAFAYIKLLCLKKSFMNDIPDEVFTAKKNKIMKIIETNITKSEDKEAWKKLKEDANTQFINCQ